MANKPQGNQFQPFDALAGFTDALKDKEKVHIEKKILSTDKLLELSDKLGMYQKGDIITIKYYYKDDYSMITGKIKNIDVIEKIITISNVKISFYDIYDIID